MDRQSTNAVTIGSPRVIRSPAESLHITKPTMTRLKDQIRLAKAALKVADSRPELYTDEELQYMKMQLKVAKQQLKEKQRRRKVQKGFGYDS